MRARCRQDQLVEVAKISAVGCQHGQSFAYGVLEMPSILCPCQTGLSGTDDLVAGLDQQGRQQLIGEVVIQVKVHASGL